MSEAVHERRIGARTCLGNVGDTLLEVGFGIGLGLGAHEGEPADPIRRLAPEFKQHIATDGATDKNSLRECEMVDQGEDVVGQLGHGKHRGIGNTGEAAFGQEDTHFRFAVTAEVGGDDPDTGQIVRHRPPVIVIERGWMETNDRQAGTGVTESEARIIGEPGRDHIWGGYAPVFGGYPPELGA